MKIALLGSTGQIGRGLARTLADAHELALYARRTDVMQAWVARHCSAASVHDLGEFPAGRFDLIINAIGDGVPGKIRAAGSDMLGITEHFDRQCLDHLKRGTARSYIFMSTGCVYGKDYAAARAPSPHPLDPEDFGADDAYPRGKRLAEVRHREMADVPIADIRIFGYVSEEIGLDDDFLLSEILRALVHGTVFETSPYDMVRDYVGLADLTELIERLIAAGVPNGAYDIISARPTTKFEVIAALEEAHGFRTAVCDQAPPVPCGHVPVAISRDAAARALGHEPQRTSLANVLATAAALVPKRPPIHRYAL